MGLTDANQQTSEDSAAKTTVGGEAVGVAVARARRAAGLTQRGLADKLDVRLWMVDEWEAGGRPIPREQFAQIASAIGVTPGELLGREVAPAPSVEPRPEARQQPSAPGPVRPAARARSHLTADQIRNADLPRGFRGYDEGATRTLLEEIAASYERATSERDKAGREVEELSAVLQRRVADFEAAVSDAENVVDREQATSVAQLRREALASAQSELEALQREAVPVLEGLLALSDHLRALISSDSVAPAGEDAG